MADTSPLLSTKDGPPQGHKICGFCCDSKRAVMIINILALIATIINMILLAGIHYSDQLDQALADNNISKDEWDKWYAISMILSGVNLGVRIMAIFGAALFKSSLVAIAALWTLAFLIYGIIVNTDHVGALILGVIWNAFIIYAHVVFVSETRSGIMSPETYDNERFSCCCV